MIVQVTSGLEEADGTTWYGVHIDGHDAWVMAEFLDSAPSEAGDQVRVVNTGGHGLRLRSDASVEASTITVLPDNAVLDVVGDEQTDESGVTWASVQHNGDTGFAHRGYLAVIVSDDPETIPEEPSEPEQPPAEPDDSANDDEGSNQSDDVVAEEPEPDPEPDTGNVHDVTVGGNAEVVNTNGAGLNVRHGAGYTNSVVTVAAEGHVMQVLDGPHIDADGDYWWNVDYRGHSGWVHGGYLRGTDAEPTGAGSASGAADSGQNDDGSNEPPASSATGERIVNEAMRYLGYPYVWGGTTPSGFDCSGFIYYVVNQVTGGGFPRLMEAQVNRGTYVPSDQLQPGDLVFQQNTYQWGLSHAGIYIGNGQFIHASTPGSGVVISNLWDSYWGQRYYTARRIS